LKNFVLPFDSSIFLKRNLIRQFFFISKILLLNLKGREVERNNELKHVLKQELIFFKGLF
jgi:hypothetical protein